MILLALVLPGTLVSALCDTGRCTCIAESSTEDAAAVVTALEEADAVFLGRVLRVQRIHRPGDADDVFADWREVTLAIERLWKGQADSRIIVRTPWHASLCGFPFESRTAYLVYARISADGRLVTDACSRTRARDRADTDILRLDQLIGRE